MNDRIDRTCIPGPAAESADIGAAAQHPGFEELRQVYLEQGWPLRSILVGQPHLCRALDKDAHTAAVGGGRTDAFLLPLADARDTSCSTLTLAPLRSSRHRPGEVNSHAFEVAPQAHQLLGDAPGNDLLLWPAQMLNEMMAQRADEFSFQAVAALSSAEFGHPHENEFRKLRRNLFDRGLICIGSAQVAGCTALCFLSSALVRSLRRCHAGSRGHITMSELRNEGGFGNQLFRYAYVKFYALRHGLTPAFPEWDGNHLFGLEDESCAHLSFRRLTFNGFDNRHRLLWQENQPPIDIDLKGYFQDIPACWGKHRPLLRRLFELAPEQQTVIDAWQHDVTRGGQRTLVAIHVRRGDYRQHQSPEAPWFRLVPERWYLSWLRTIWPSLSNPLLFVATDEPEAILPVFGEFELDLSRFRRFGATITPSC